jgi:hypothetical protein
MPGVYYTPLNYDGSLVTANVNALAIRPSTT